jgi:hypothetical protein
MVPSDQCILMYREKQKEWAQRGWRIDWDALKRNDHRVAYAIPSPARREHKGWVLDPVPMVPPEAAPAQAAKSERLAG